MILRVIGAALALILMSPVSAQDTPRKGALRFNWTLPARLRVTEKRTVDGETVASQMVISVAAEGEGLRLKHEDLKIVDAESEPLTPEEKEVESKLLAAIGPLPDLLMNRDGTGVRVDGLEEAVKRWLEAISGLDTEGVVTEAARKRAQSPELLTILQNKFVERWHIWVAGWLNIKLGPGQKIEHVREIPLGKTLVDAPAVLEHMGVVGPRTVRIRLVTTLEGEAAREAFRKMLGTMLGDDTKVPQVIEFRRTASTKPPPGLQPLSRSTSYVLLAPLASGGRSEAHLEVT